MNKESTMSATENKDKRTSVAKRPGTARLKKDKKAARLFVSFWNICLENLPEGTFRHRRLTADDIYGFTEWPMQNRFFFPRTYIRPS